jgi:hypothetical protein
MAIPAAGSVWYLVVGTIRSVVQLIPLDGRLERPPLRPGITSHPVESHTAHGTEHTNRWRSPARWVRSRLCW